MEMIKLTIDGKPVEVEKNTTILKAARTVGIEIHIGRGAWNSTDPIRGRAPVQIHSARLPRACSTAAHNQKVNQPCEHRAKWQFRFQAA